MKRPVSVTVFAIINLVLGGLGVLAFAWWLVTRLRLIEIPGQANSPAYQALQNNPAYMWFTDIANILNIVAAVVTLTAGIGLLQMRPWARVTTTAWGGYQVVAAVVAGIVSYFVVVPPMLANADPRMRPVMVVSLVAGYAFSAVFLGYYVLMMVLLNRPGVKEAFAQAAAAQAQADDPAQGVPGV